MKSNGIVMNDTNPVIGMILTTLSATSLFLLDNWIEIVGLVFSGIAVVYTVKSARASIKLRNKELESEDIEIKLKKLALQKAEFELKLQESEIKNCEDDTLDVD